LLPERVRESRKPKMKGGKLVRPYRDCQTVNFLAVGGGSVLTRLLTASARAGKSRTNDSEDVYDRVLL
jgi:hypothetical protein